MSDRPDIDLRPRNTTLPALKALDLEDARVGWLSMSESRAMAAACDRWLASRGIRTTMSWPWPKKSTQEK